jgi:hypothetical protein
LYVYGDELLKEKRMSNFIELIALATSLLALVFGIMTLPRYAKVSFLAVTLFVVSALSFSQPSLADANDNALTQNQQKFQETLRTSPSGTQYQGLEYVTDVGELQSDRQIEREIRSKAPNNLKLSVSSGSVRLSGRVQNREAAQDLVQEIKNISGVHEVSYDLGLEEAV